MMHSLAHYLELLYHRFELIPGMTERHQQQPKH